MSTIDQFGFLPVEFRFECADFRIYPVDGFQKLVEDMGQYLSRDGFLYPHYECKTHMYKLSPTHNIEFTQSGCIEDISKLRLGILGFIMHLIGYIYGIRLQFHGWWLDGRIAFEGQHNITISEENIKKFLEHSLNTFKAWGDDDQEFFINILYMHNRSPSYEWDWERFTIAYMVFDACWKFSKLAKVPHAERIKRICEEYSLHYDKEVVERIVGLRNDLFHEALWSNDQPGTAAEAQDFMASYNLRRLNHRIIPALLGYKSIYLKSNWTSIGCYNFD